MAIENRGLLLLLAQPNLTDVLLNGESDAFADFGVGLQRIEHPCPNAFKLAELARWLIEIADRHLDFANPFSDCSLSAVQLGLAVQAQFRVHAVLAGPSSPHTLISIRKHPAESIGLHEFTAGRLELELWLRGMLTRRENFLVSGSTGAGKTTFLRAMMSQAQGDRIIAIEEVTELAPIAGHLVSLQTRQPNTEGRGGIDLEQLMREALRMRPDRLLLGEVRGPELLTLLNALNTGHRGAGGTIHANDAEAVATRITTIGLQSGWPARAVAAAAAEAVQWVIHVERRAHGRVVTAVSSLTIGRRGQLQTAPCAELAGFL